MRVTALCAAVVAVLATAVPAHATSDCVWTSSTLPLPAGVERGTVVAAGPDGHLAGTAGNRIVRWHHRQLVELPVPAGHGFQVKGINRAGHVVGYDSKTLSAVVHRNGAFELLPSPADDRATATGINSAGDIVGYLGNGATPFRVVIWPAARPGTYEVVAPGQALGIDDEGRVVTEEGLIWSPDGTTRAVRGHPYPVIEVFGGGRLIGRNGDTQTESIEWDLTGAVVRELGIWPASAIGANANGLLATWYFKDFGQGGNTLGTWRHDTFMGDLGSQLRVLAVTDADELAGFGPPAVPGKPWVPMTWACV